MCLGFVYANTNTAQRSQVLGKREHNIARTNPGFSFFRGEELVHTGLVDASDSGRRRQLAGVSPTVITLKRFDRRASLRGRAPRPMVTLCACRKCFGKEKCVRDFFAVYIYIYILCPAREVLAAAVDRRVSGNVDYAFICVK